MIDRLKISRDVQAIQVAALGSGNVKEASKKVKKMIDQSQ